VTVNGTKFGMAHRVNWNGSPARLRSSNARRKTDRRNFGCRHGVPGNCGVYRFHSSTDDLHCFNFTLARAQTRSRTDNYSTSSHKRVRRREIQPFCWRSVRGSGLGAVLGDRVDTAAGARTRFNGTTGVTAAMWCRYRFPLERAAVNGANTAPGAVN